MRQESVFNELLTELEDALVFHANDSERITTLSESLRLIVDRGDSKKSLLNTLNKSPDSICSIYLDRTLDKSMLFSLIETSFLHSDIVSPIQLKAEASFRTQIANLSVGSDFNKKSKRKVAEPAEKLVEKGGSQRQRESTVKYSLRGDSVTTDAKTEAKARQNNEDKREITNRHQEYAGNEASQEKFDWMSIFLKEFKKNLTVLDLKLKGRVADAILDIAVNPTSVKGDTKKPLTHDLSGKWRYRLGDYRLIYMPVIKAQTIYYLDIANRGSVYDG
jgi:mRNA-degrading endonuclease RelE of RelBE toxin-antitoxin system